MCKVLKVTYSVFVGNVGVEKTMEAAFSCWGLRR